MGRLIISKQLEKAAGQNFIAISDVNGDLQYQAVSSVVEANETAIAFTTDGDATGVSLSGTNDHTIDIVLLSLDAGNELNSGSDGGLFLSQLKEQQVVATIAARDALVGMIEGDIVYVTDASADATVNSGWAVYMYVGAAWVKIGEQESLDGTASSFTISDGVTTQTINNGETLLFTQGEGILADVVATDQLNIELRRVYEEFSVSSVDGDNVTLAGTPPTDEDLIEVFRNGLLVEDSAWSISGSVITFTSSFGGSTSGTDAETVEVRYFEG